METPIKREELREMYREETNDSMFMSRADRTRYIVWLEDQILESNIIIISN